MSQGHHDRRRGRDDSSCSARDGFLLSGDALEHEESQGWILGEVLTPMIARYLVQSVTGQEIADTVLAHIHTKGWSETWKEYDGFRVTPNCRVWLDGYADWDYEATYLFRVWTDIESLDDPDVHCTVTDHLAVLWADGEVTCEWRDKPMLFWDAVEPWGAEGMHWWVDWCHQERHAAYEPSSPASEAANAFLQEHNRQVSAKDHENARYLGLDLIMPYLRLVQPGETC